MIHYTEVRPEVWESLHRVISNGKELLVSIVAEIRLIGLGDKADLWVEIDYSTYGQIHNYFITDDLHGTWITVKVEQLTIGKPRLSIEFHVVPNSEIFEKLIRCWMIYIPN